MNVIEFIRQKVESGESQSAVARKCGISQALVNKMMYEDYPVKLETIKKVATAYKTPLSFFIDGTGPLAIMQPDVVDGIRQYPDPIDHQEDQLTISEQIGSGYGPEVKLVADYLEVKIKGKTAEERLQIVEEIMEQVRSKYK